MKRYFCLLLATLFLFGGCSAKSPAELPDGTASENSSLSSSTPSEADFAETDTDMFTDRDSTTVYDASDAVAVELKGSTASCSSPLVSISGSRVTVTGEGTFVFSGTLSNGMIIIDAPDTAKLQIVLNGASVTSNTSAALYVKEADKVFVTLNEDTENSLINGGAFEAIDENNIDAAVFSKQDITFNGEGGLTVTSPSGHGIVSKDDLVFTGGSYLVFAASHGLDANDSVRVTNASFSITSGKDGIHSENSDDAEQGFVYISSGSFDITAQGDGISASNYLNILGGSFDIITGGGYENAQKQTSDNWGGFMGGGPTGPGGPMGGRPTARPQSYTTASTDTDSSTSIKGLKSAGSLKISGGSFSINSADDAVHSNLSVTVEGGTFDILTGDDGIHADEKLSISAGKITVSQSYEGLEALNVAVSAGEIKLVCTDDGINAAGGVDSSGTGGFRGGDNFGGMTGGASNGSVVISGGKIYINSSGDGIDANGTLEITGGHTTVVGPTQGDTATLDYDRSAVISGGTFIGTGAQGMAQTFSDSPQGVIAVSTDNCSAGTALTLKDSSGKTLITHTPELSFAVVILSSPEVVSGKSYTLTVGSASEKITAN